MTKAYGHTTADSMIPRFSVSLPVVINAQPSIKTIKLSSFLLANELQKVIVHGQPVHACQHSPEDFLPQASA